jgi:peptidylprolyl isomerase
VNNQNTLPHKDWIEQTKTKLDALDHSLTTLARRAEELKGETADRIQSKIMATRVLLDGWRERWSEAEGMASDVWETASTELAAAWDTSRAAFDKSLSEIRSTLDSESPRGRRAKRGDTVLVDYVGRLQDGTEFQTTQGRDPIEFVLGKGHVIEGVEKAVSGMHVGDATTARIPVEDGFGPRQDSLVFRLSRDRFPEEEPPALGDRVTVRPEKGKPLLVTVRRVEDDVVEVDANHPLAGHELHMDLKLVGIA